MIDNALVIKEDDVFEFTWKPLPDDAHWSLRGDRYHCLDGQLVATKFKDGLIYLVDTYWVSSSDNLTFTIEEALQKGELSFRFNINNYIEIKEYNLQYYDNTDIENFSKQHGCYKCYMLKRGAKRSKEKMLKVLDQKEYQANNNIRYANDEIERIKENRAKIEAGNLEVFI